MLLRDRAHGGAELAELLEPMRRDGLLPDPIVLALPRGGVPVAEPIARTLRAPLDVVLAHKIGLPGQPELGVGAIAGTQEPFYDQRTLAVLGVTERELAPEVEQERARLAEAERRYREGRPQPRLADRSVVVVDDGLATGVTARAALRLVRGSRPRLLALAVPVGAADTVAALRAEADEVICPHTPARFGAVGLWYQEFDQVSDEEVSRVLRAFASGPPEDEVD
jgi:predicted phosphoribosyltransferase